MIWVLLTILSATGIFVFFKLFDKYKLPNLNGIVINYLVAGLLGFAISPNREMVTEIFNADWALLAIIIGVLFILMFFVIGYSSIVSGMSLTTLASKMSVVIPILFSIVYFGEPVTYIKVFGLILALVGLVLAVYKKRKDGKLSKQFWIPIILFLGMGCVDSLVKFAQETYVSDEISSVFTALLFFVSFLVGLLIMLTRPKTFKAFKKPRLLALGAGLGIVNYGSIYFLIRALNSKVFDSSVIFGINNIGIITLSAMIGFVFFKERLTRLNWIGLIICIVAILVLYITK
ncbi:MAG: DMT family transporter [Bacteroidota bacterium]|nr:DMT family transporter [Bacteroidota bacterium]